MAARKERVHHQGHSNRSKGWTVHAAVHGDQPINFDSSLRSLNSRKMTHSLDTFVPLGALEGTGHREFAPRLPGHDYRQPHADPFENATLRKELSEAEKPETSIAALDKVGARVDDPTRYRPRALRPRAPRVAPRWNPAKWHQDPPEERAPLQKEEGETWNSLESQKVQGSIQARDRLNRSVRRPEDVETPRSDAGGAATAIDFDRQEYYPGRSTIDNAIEEPDSDFQIRPINLPDFNHPPPRHIDGTTRMQRLRELLRQRYAGRPRLINVFRNCALQKSGYVFAKDLQMVFDQMGIKADESECEMLITAVDKDDKRAVNFEEFADLIYGAKVNVGGADYEPKERHVRHVTNVLVDRLVANGQALGKAFCELDPQRQYLVSKQQFTNALGTACNHISKQAVEFLWAAQFSGENQAANLNDRCVDWRSFMSQLAHYSHEHRPPTPCTLQGRKRQYDLLQRSAAITGGYLPDMDLHRPDQDPDEKVIIKADKLCFRPSDMLDMPRDVSFFTEPYLEDIRAKAWRCEHALPQQISKARLKVLLKDRPSVHQDELVDLICNELQAPGLQESLPSQAPRYAAALDTAKTEVLNLDGPQSASAAAGEKPRMQKQDEPAKERPGLPEGTWGSDPRPVSLQLNRADIKAYISRQNTNRDHEVDAKVFLRNLFMPEDERKVMHTVNDGLNPHIRGLRPPRERPSNTEHPRHENYWQARYMMEMLGDGIAVVENSNGGRLKSSKMFKRLDMDNDGYISLSDLKSACDKYKVAHGSADLHALFSQLDKADNGCIDIGEFTRNYEMHQGNLLDSMSRPIRAVHHDGGIQYAGPVQDELDARDRRIAAEHAAQGRASSAPAGAVRGGSSGSSCGSRQLPGILDSSISLGHGRVTDVMRARYGQWKAHKSELYTTPGKTRFGMSVHPDTRHITEPSVPMSAAFMQDSERFKTTSGAFNIFATPDVNHAQTTDALQKHSRNEFRTERVRQREREFAGRCWAANQAVQDYDERKIARKALTQINYERRCRMACS